MKNWVVFLFIFLNVSFISAVLTLGDVPYLLQNQYAPQENIKGWINVSFENEPASSLFEINLLNDSKIIAEDSINLIEIINKEPNFKKSCFPIDCLSNYETIGSGKESTQFQLNEGEEKILGFVISGENLISMENFALDIQSNAPKSSVPQLYIDVLNDNSFEWISHKASGDFSDYLDYGCFSSEIGGGLIGYDYYCNYMDELYPSPRIKIGANILNRDSGSADFILRIENLDTRQIGECSVEGVNIEEGTIECIPTTFGEELFKITEKGNFSVCIAAKNFESEGKYEINYGIDPVCRGSGSPNFQTFVRYGVYAPIGNFRLDGNEMEKSTGVYTNIEAEITNYIFNRYEGVCLDKCIVPIRFYSNVGQSVGISGINLRYRVIQFDTPITTSTRNIFEIDETPTRISSDFQKLNLNPINFNVPEEFGKYTLQLNLLGDEKTLEILEKDITVERIPEIISLNKRIKTIIVPAAYSQTFEITKIEKHGSISEIINYHWDFGDGSIPRSTMANKTQHTYNEIGEYNLTITITDSSGFNSSKTFNIEVQSPKNAITRILEEMQRDISIVEEQINDFSISHRQTIKQRLNFDDAKTLLEELQEENKIADSDEEYIEIMQRLSSEMMMIPQGIFKVASVSNNPFIPNVQEIDLDLIKEITGEDYDINKRDTYIELILAFNLNDLDLNFDYSEYSVIREDKSERLVTIIELDFKGNPKTENAYLIIKGLIDLEIRQDSGVKKDRYAYIPLDSQRRTIEFATSEKIIPYSLPVFASPPFEELPIYDFTYEEGFFERHGWSAFIVMIIFLLVAGAIIYIILGKWYQHRYENYLFPKKNQLYNLANYIHTSKRKGVKNKDISTNLKKSGWNSEQIAYAMKKYAGKHVGLPGIGKNKLPKKKKNFQNKRI